MTSLDYTPKNRIADSVIDEEAVAEPQSLWKFQPLLRSLQPFNAEDKSKTNVRKLHDFERVKYEIHNAVKAALKRSRTWWDLGNQLQKQGIGMTFKINRRTGKNEGLSFTKDGYTFKASDVSREFSY